MRGITLVREANEKLERGTLDLAYMLKDQSIRQVRYNKELGYSMELIEKYFENMSYNENM